MRLPISCQIFLGLCLLSQFGNGDESIYDKDKVLNLQKKVEHLIEKILNVIQNYYQEIKTQFKCIPDEIPDKIVDVLKSSIDCADENEKNRLSMTDKNHRKNFLKCFSKAKQEIEETMANINTTVDHCPENMTEKTYQINVTTFYTKVFHINIKNGLEITKKEIQSSGRGALCQKDKEKEAGVGSSWGDDDDDDDEDANEEYYDTEKGGDIYNIKDGPGYHKVIKNLQEGEQGRFDKPKLRDLNTKPDAPLMRKAVIENESGQYSEKSKLSSVRTDVPEYIMHGMFDYGE